MKSKTVSGFALILLLVGMLTFTFNIQSVKPEPAKWTVDDDGGADFTKIQDAIKVANLGDTIYIYNGIYYENVVVDKALWLIGENKSTTIIDGSEQGPIINVVADNVHIIELTVRNAGSPSSVPGSAEELRTWASFSGIYLERVRSCNLSANAVTNSFIGIHLFSSTNNTIQNNDVRRNQFRGIFVALSQNNTILNNDVKSTWANQGILLESSCNNLIISNNASKNQGEGIYLFSSDSNVLKYNTVNSNNANGIYVHSSNNNTILSNKISYNRGSGILVDWYNSFNRIASNKICLNSYGVLINVRSNHTFVTTNTISLNSYGIYLSYYSSYNIIYHNNFIDNLKQVETHYDSVNNTWDNGYPPGGNYWSDHVCTGNPSDGSQPYVIDANNIDLYPFQDPNGWLLHQLTITSSPITGVTFTIDGVPQTTPYNEWLLEGSYTLEMPETHDGYVWSHWLEDGDTNRIKTATVDTSITWTGVFTIVPPPPTGQETSPTIKLINEPESETPWIWLSTIILPLVLTVVYVKKRKRHTEINS